MVQISGGVAGSVERLKKDLERGSGNTTWIRNIKAGEDLTVRFLTEPEDWFSYREHYNPETKFFPCIGKATGCPGCQHPSEKVSRASRRYLANALVVNEGVVVPLKLPLDLANRLVVRYERNGNTLGGRDYTLHRMGQGLDTSYDVTPEDKSDVDLQRFELLDLEEILVEQFEDAYPSGSNGVVDDDDEVPSEPSRHTSGPEMDTEESDEGEYLTEEQAMLMDKDELKTLADSVGATIDKRWAKSRIVKAIFDAAG